MNSGWPDLQGAFGGTNLAAGPIYDLVTYIQNNSSSTFPATGLFPGNMKFCLGGHSNGGFFTQRWYYEGAPIFAAYFSTSGALANSLVADVANIKAGNYRIPLWMQFGAQDTVLGIANANQYQNPPQLGPNPPFYNFFDNTWNEPVTEESVQDLTFPALSTHLGAWNEVQQMCSALGVTAPSLSAFKAMGTSGSGSTNPVPIGNLCIANANPGSHGNYLIQLRLLTGADHHLQVQTQALCGNPTNSTNRVVYGNTFSMAGPWMQFLEQQYGQFVGTP
jgi:hypothetical protein